MPPYKGRPARVQSVRAPLAARAGVGNQQGLVSASLGAAHALAAPVNGSNLDYSGVSQAFSPDTLTIMTAFHSGTLRYPGGAISNYWTWQTGSVDQPAQRPAPLAGRRLNRAWSATTGSS